MVSLSEELDHTTSEWKIFDYIRMLLYESKWILVSSGQDLIFNNNAANLSDFWHVTVHTLQPVEIIVEMKSLRAFFTVFEAWAVKCWE